MCRNSAVARRWTRPEAARVARGGDAPKGCAGIRFRGQSAPQEPDDEAHDHTHDDHGREWRKELRKTMLAELDQSAAIDPLAGDLACLIRIELNSLI